ncbi:MAG: hypothetical protein FWC69_02645, partial [Defluviitaleaceae bacterium]|nr:hypothetical protein [Defluviitaleaceae bacterium]
MDIKHMPVVFGALDQNIIKIEKALGVSIFNREGKLTIEGAKSDDAWRVISKLADMAKDGQEVDEIAVNYLLASIGDGTMEQVESSKGSNNVVCITATGKAIKPKT